MTKKNNVKESANTKTPLHSDSTADQRTKRKTKNKLRLHSKLKVNVPLSQSLMLILPSLAKLVSASPQEHDVQDTPNDVIDSEDQRSQEDMNLLAEEHPKSDIIENTAPSDKTEAGNANSEQPQNSTLTPSHHLSSLSHPQVHYVPAVSIPTISSGQVPQPTTRTPVTPDLPVTFLPEVISGKYGELHVDANGHYTFVLNPLSPQYVLLHQNQPGTDQFMLHLSNGSQLVVQIPVAGKQDIPTISGDLRGVVIEDHNVDSHGLLSASGKIDVVDPDHDQSSVTAETITGQYGSLSIDANGKWHYQVDNSLSNVQALTSLTSLHESFTIHTKDGTPQTIEMTIGGNDDNAIVSGVDAGSVTEDQTTQVHGQLTVTDSDLGQDHFQASLLTGQFGTLVLSKDGAWTYNLDNGNPAVQKLAHGSTATDIITVHSADGTAHQVTVTINGTNDQAVITSSTAGSPNSFAAIPTNPGSNQVTEDLNTTVVGQLNITDVDSNEAHFSNSDIKGVLGTLHLKDDGEWRYDLDNKNPNVQALGKGNSATDTITIHSADGTPHQITITVNGTNDKAIIGGTSSGAVTEESQLQTSGTLTVTDVDTGEAHFSNTDITGALGTLHLTDVGGWTYDLDNTNPTVQALGKGATATDTITVHSADGTPHQVTITINGTDDKAVIGGTNTGAVTEESQLHTSGTLTVTDVDSGEAHFSNTDTVGALGTLHLTDSGKWTYDLDNTNPTVQALGKGATATDTITVHSADGTPHQVTITINGTNDTAVIGGTNTGAVAEESQLHTSGTLTVTDVDTGEAHFSNSDIVGALGTLHLTDTGGWTYDLDNTNPTVQALGKGATATDTITVHSADGTPHQVTITVNGTNDKAVIGGTNAGAVTEESQLHVSGTLTVTDVDTGQAHFSNTDIVGSLGTLHLTDTGGWTYDLNNANATAQALGKGSTATDTITIHSADGTPHQITITVNGTNDKAIIGGTSSGAVTEESQLQTSGTLTVTDVDNGEAHFSNTDIAGALGTLHLTDTGGWTYDLDNSNSTVQALSKGATATDTITVHSADGTPHQVTITVNGTNDKAIIGGTSSGTVTEESQLQTSGTLTVTDVDTGEAHFSNTDIAGTLGTLHLTDSGSWTYDLDNTNPTVQALGKGATATDTITVHSADGTPHQVTITVNGTNDKAVIGGTSSGAVTEESQLHTSGTLTVTDLDTGEAHFSNTDIVGSFGTLHLTDSGKWTYDLDNTNPTVQALGKGSTATDAITVHSADGTPHQITITVNGTDDTAVIGGQDTGSVDEGHGHYSDMSPDYGKTQLTSEALYADGKLTIADPDTGDNEFDPKGGGYDYQGQYGRVNLHQDGTWHYMVDIGHNRFTNGTSTTSVGTTIDQLGDGQSLTDTITVYSKDGTSHDIVVTIHGDNDRPYISSEVTLATGKEDTALTFTKADLLANTIDVDTNDAGKLSIANLLVDHGSVVDNKDGTYTFTPTNNYNGQVHFSYDVTDAHGGTTHTGASTTLSAVNDAAVIAGTDTGDVTEDSFNGMQWLITKGQLTITDSDAGEDIFDPVVHAQNYSGIGYDTKLGGHVLLSRDGTWEYQLDNFSPEVQKLAAGETALDTVTIHSVDGTTHEIQITIHGTNDAPVLAVTQSTPTTGTLTETDIDTKDTHSFSVVTSTGQFGDLSVDPTSGSYVYTPHSSVAGMTYNTATHTYHGLDVFEVKVADNHGGEDSKFITFDANGQVSVIPGQQPTISATVPKTPTITTGQPTLPSGTNTAPTNAVTLDLAASSDSGVSQTDNLTKDSTPTITGHTDIPYSQVTIYDGSTPIGQAVSDGSGHYSVAVSNLANGDHNLSAKALAPSSTLPATSPALSVHVDTDIAPLQVSLTHDTGSNSSDLITNDGSLTITGQEAGATVEYSTDNGHTWTSSFTPQQGANTVSVRQTDPAGNVSSPTSLTFTYDDQIAAPAIDLNSSTDSGISATDDLTNVHTPIITGSAEANSSISITDETGKMVATGTANSSGVYQLTTSNIAEGSHTFTVTSTDVAGNQSSASLPIEVDYTAPTVSNVNLTSVTNHQPTFNGTVSLDTTSVDIVIKSGGTVVETLHATLDGHGGYTVDATNLPDNHYVAFIQATDKAGNTTASSYAGTFDRFSVDTHASAPTISFENTGADNIYNAAEVASGAANTITSTIHLPPDAQPKDTLTINGQSHLITDAEFLAKSVNIEVAPGASITASITDTNGNTSTVTNATAPSSDTAVSPLQVSLTHDTGSNSSDLITNDGSLTITGQEAGATVEYSTDNGHTWTSNFTPQQGANTVSVRQTDPAGNVSSPTSLTFNYDNQIAAPAIDLKSSTDSGISTTDDLTNVHTPIITGSAEANSSISITDETGKVVATGTANSSGVYQLTTSNIAEGSHTFTVTSTDVAGNQNSASLPIEVDYTAPTISNVNLSSVATHQPTFSGTVSLDTTSVDIVIKSGSTIVETLHATLDGNGGYTVDATNLPDNHYVAYIQATDKAGNTTASGYTGTFDRFSVDTHASAPTISFESTGADNIYNAAEVASGAANTITSTIHLPSDAQPKDTLTINGQSHLITDAEYLAKSVNVEVAPGASIAASITDKNGNTSIVANSIAPSADTNVAPLQVSLTHDTGSSTSDLVTSDGALTISGQEAGATVEYSTDNGHTWTSSFTPQQGSNTVSVRQTDPAGNVSADTLVTFTLDNTASAPTVSLNNDTGRHFINTPDLITKDSQLSIQTEAGAKVEYSNDGGHTWTTAFNPIEGVNDLQVRQTDIAGNVSPATHFSFTLDTTPGTVTVNPISQDNALNAAENNQPLVITGTTSNIAPGDVVYVVVGNNHFYDATVKSDGTWSLTLSASEHQNIMATDRDYPIQVGTVDTAGNSTPRISTHLLIDTDAPLPSITVNSVTSDDIINKIEAGGDIDITGHVSGDFNTGDTVSLTINGQAIPGYTAQVQANGNYLVTVPSKVLLSHNIHSNSAQVHSIEATISTHDAVGNTGSASTGVRPFTYDIRVDAPQISLTHDTGNAQDHITSDGALTVAGQETGATIEYSIDGGHTWSNTFTPQTGTNTVEVRQTDTAGNVSTSSSLTFTLDNTATAPSVSLTSDSGGSSSDKITNVGDLSVGGIEQGATVEYSIDNGVHWSTQFSPAEGQNNVQVRQTDVAGNVSPSTSLSYTLDTQIDIRVNSAQVDQHGQGMMVQVYFPKDSEITLIEITSDGGGTPLLVDLSTVRKFSTSSSVRNPDHQYQEFVGIDLSSLPDGNLSIRVAGTDTAGNTVTAQSSASSNYVLDTTASASDDSNTAIEDSTIPVSGNLLSNDADAATVTTTGDIQGTYGLFHLNKDGSYTYTLDNQLSTIQQLNSTSTPLVDSITYTASDNHGNHTTAHLAISIQGTDDNHPPAVTGQTVSTNEDTTKTFTTSEFGYSDQDGDALQFVTINSIPSHGLLLLNGKAVIANQQVSKAELDAGHLTFTPINNENGANYAQFTFTANDGHQNSASATMILNVNAVNDAPIVGSSFISSLEDKPHAFTAADFKYSDIDGDALNHITITNVAHGVLTLNGATVNVGDDVSASDISSLIFTPTHNYFSSNTNGLGAVQFTANDGHIDSKEGSIFINIADVADPATFGGDSTGAAQEDTTLQASGTLTASDPDGTVGFIAVQGGVGIVGSKGYGHAHIDSNGHWTYDLYNKHPIVQQLGQGQTDTETITIQSADGTQHDIVITITGTNDLPTVSEKPQAGHIIGQHSVDEDSNLNPAGQLIINDVDGDTTNVALDPTHSAAYGHVVFDAHSGTWVYHLDNSNPTVNALNDNDTLQDKFTLLVDDGHGQKVPQEITMTINGHTDPVPYAPPTISVTVDTRHAHHVTAGITPSTLQAYAHSIRGHATTVSGSHEIKGHGHSDIIIVSGRLHEEAELEGGNDILFLGGRLTDKEIEGGHGSDTLILGAYNRNNAPRLHDHGEKISDGHEEMELESIENIILGDGTVLKGHLPANFPLVTHDHYEVPVNIQAHLSSGDESVSSIRLTHLQQGLTLQSNGHNINANHDGSYTVPANGHLVVVSDHPMNNGHHYFETEVTTHNSVTGVTAVTTEDLQGHIQSHVNPPPPPPPPVQHDEPDSPLTFEASVTIVDDSNTQNEQQHVGVTDSQHHDVSHHGAAAYLDALGITPDATSTTVHDQPADMDIVLAQVDHPDATTHDQAHLDMSDALEHHDANVNHNQDDEHHHHNDLDGLPDIDPNH